MCTCFLDIWSAGVNKKTDSIKLTNLIRSNCLRYNQCRVSLKHINLHFKSRVTDSPRAWLFSLVWDICSYKTVDGNHLDFREASDPKAWKSIEFDSRMAMSEWLLSRVWAYLFCLNVHSAPGRAFWSQKLWTLIMKAQRVDGSVSGIVIGIEKRGFWVFIFLYIILSYLFFIIFSLYHYISFLLYSSGTIYSFYIYFFIIVGR